MKKRKTQRTERDGTCPADISPGVPHAEGIICSGCGRSHYLPPPPTDTPLARQFGSIALNDERTGYTVKED